MKERGNKSCARSTKIHFSFLLGENVPFSDLCLVRVLILVIMPSAAHASLLSKGAVYAMCNGQSPSPAAPTLQILGLKKVSSSGSDKYRAYISDGQYANSFSMLATQMNEKVKDGGLETFALFKLNNFTCNNMQGKKVIIMLDVDVVKPAAEVGARLGEPIMLKPDGSINPEDAQKAKMAVKRAAEDAAGSPAKRSPLSENRVRNGGSVLSPRPAMAGASQLDPNNVNVVPIASLTPYQNRWTICARVTNKSAIRRWSNSRGEGHLFSMDLLDESGEIRATAFKEQCDKYYNMIEVGKLYYITSCSLKAANKQYSQLNNDYEMTFRDSTEMLPCSEDSTKIPTLSFNFVQIGDLSNLNKDSVTDVIGVVKTANPAAAITTKTGKQLTKRDLVLVDQSLTEVGLTLWGAEAETFDGSAKPVVAVKGAKVSDFNGVPLATMFSSVLQVNPDLPQAHTLRGWFDSDGCSASTTSLTVAGSRALAGGDGNVKSLAEIKLDTHGKDLSSRPEYYSTEATVTMFQKDKALYQACSREVDGKSCNKKVTDQGNGTYRCEKCNVELTDFRWRCILNFSASDATSSQWATCFQEQAEAILGVTSQDLGVMYTTEQDAYNQVFADATFKRFNFRLSAKTEFYNEESRVRMTVRAAAAPEVKDVAKRLIKYIQEAGGELPEVASKFM